jgi:hypothetical protein
MFIVFLCNINHCNASAPCWDLDWTIKSYLILSYLYYIALLNILFLKIYVQKLTCCSWKLGFRGIIFSARKLQEYRILHHLPQSFWGSSAAPRPPVVRPPLRGRWGWVTSWPSTRHLNRFEYTSFWGSYAPVWHFFLYSFLFQFWPHVLLLLSTHLL